MAICTDATPSHTQCVPVIFGLPRQAGYDQAHGPATGTFRANFPIPDIEAIQPSLGSDQHPPRLC